MTAQQEIAAMVFDALGVQPTPPQVVVMECGVVVGVRRATRTTYGRSPLAGALHDAVRHAQDFESSFRSARDLLGQRVAEDIDRQIMDMVTPNCRCVTVPIDSRDRQRREMVRTTRTMPTGGYPAIRKLEDT